MREDTRVQRVWLIGETKLGRWMVLKFNISRLHLSLFLQEPTNIRCASTGGTRLMLLPRERSRERSFDFKSELFQGSEYCTVILISRLEVE